MAEQIILVDPLDRPVGSAEKLAAHRQPLLHRAFSIFLYDGSHLLLQQRAAHKYHSGGMWANSCCSHPRLGEGLAEAAARRLPEELGVSCPLTEINSFVYYHQFADDLYEYEFDHIFVGPWHGAVRENPDEVAAAAWVEADELAADLLALPARYAPWFRKAAPFVLAWLARR